MYSIHWIYKSPDDLVQIAFIISHFIWSNFDQFLFFAIIATARSPPVSNRTKATFRLNDARWFEMIHLKWTSFLNDPRAEVFVCLQNACYLENLHFYRVLPTLKHLANSISLPTSFTLPPSSSVSFFITCLPLCLTPCCNSFTSIPLCSPDPAVPLVSQSHQLHRTKLLIYMTFAHIMRVVASNLLGVDSC